MTQYLQISIRSGTSAPSGPELARITRLVLREFPTEWVALSDVDLMGDARPFLVTEGQHIRCLPVTTFLNLVEDAKSIDWASVFLCKSRETAESIPGWGPYHRALERAEALIRVVDTTYYYIFGPVKRLERLHDVLVGDEKRGEAADLDYPE